MDHISHPNGSNSCKIRSLQNFEKVHELIRKRYQQLPFHAKCKIINKQFAHSMFLIFLVFCVVLCFCFVYYLCNQCISPLKLWVRIPIMARCTRYNIVIMFVSELQKCGGFMRYFSFLQYNWTIVESSIKHLIKCLSPLMVWVRTLFMARCIR
jgi:hypothetical protein